MGPNFPNRKFRKIFDNHSTRLNFMDTTSTILPLKILRQKDPLLGGQQGLPRRQEQGPGHQAPGHEEIIPFIALVRFRGLQDGGLGLEPGVGQ
jgi:hypothetical protein